MRVNTAWLATMLAGAALDLVGLRARTKLLMQIVAATVAVLYGLHWPALELLLGWDNWWLTPPLTALFLLIAPAFAMAAVIRLLSNASIRPLRLHTALSTAGLGTKTCWGPGTVRDTWILLMA